MLTRRWLLTSLLTAVAFAAPAMADRWVDGRDNEIRLRLGVFTPRGDGDYFLDKKDDFTGDAQGLEDATYSVEWLRNVAPALDLSIGAGGYEGAQTQRYRDFTDNRGNSIFHDTTLEVQQFELGLQLRLAPRDAPIVPYLAAGGGWYAYTLTESGEFIDFTPPPATIFDDEFIAEGDALGYYLAAGLKARLGRDWGLFAEARWRKADDELSGDFSEFGTLDLSGREISAGVSWHF
jgi:hypothetical protein